MAGRLFSLPRRRRYGPPGGGLGGVCSRRGACPAGMHPPFSFRSCPKRKRAVHGPKEKGAFCRAPVQLPSARDGGRRIGASADLAWPSGTLQSSARSILPSRGGWCGGRRGARSHLNSFSFRAFRFARRCLVLRGSVSGSGERGRGYPCTSPGWWLPQGLGVSVPDCREGQPTIPRRRQEVRIHADRPAEHFFFSTGRGAFSF